MMPMVRVRVRGVVSYMSIVRVRLMQWFMCRGYDAVVYVQGS